MSYTCFIDFFNLNYHPKDQKVSKLIYCKDKVRGGEAKPLPVRYDDNKHKLVYVEWPQTLPELLRETS
jgi:hypothetical protein